MIQFYSPDIATSSMLPEEEARHCIKVLRHSVGDTITVMDGKGNRYTCTLMSDNPRKAEVDIVSVEKIPDCWDTFITIIVAPTKNIDRMEWMTEKLTEIGVNRIIPIKCEHSERKDIKLDRLNRIAVSAAKQSLKASVPEITEMIPLKALLSSSAYSAEKLFVGYCDSAVERKLLAKELHPGIRSVNIMIGPEGDFSPEEISTVVDSGYVPVTFGDNRLRTETAAIVACDTIHIVNQLKNL